MINFENSEVLNLYLNKSFNIVGTDESFLSYFQTSEAKKVESYLKKLNDEITINLSKVKIKDKEIEIIIEGFKATNYIVLKIYKYDFFFSTGHDLLKHSLVKDGFVLVYNFTKRKIVYLKDKDNFLILNNYSSFNQSAFSSLKLATSEGEKLVKTVKKALNSDENSQKVNIKINFLDEERFFQIITKTANINGSRYGIFNALDVESFQNIKVNKKEYSKDRLTNFYDYRGIQDATIDYIEEFDPVGFDLLILKIDNLMNLNNFYGRVFVDQVVKQIAEILNTHFGYTSMIARVSGDKFVVVTKNKNKIIDILTILQALDKEISSISFKGNQFRIFVRAGMTVYEKEKTFETLYIEGSKALLATYSGKDNFIFYEEEVHSQIDIIKDAEKTNLNNNKQDNSSLFLRTIMTGLINNKDTHRVFNDTIYKMLNYYGFDRVVFIAKTKFDNYRFEAYSQTEYAKIGTQITSEVIEKFGDIYDNDNMSLVNDYETLKYNSPQRYAFLEAINTKSEVIFKLNNEDINHGYLLVQYCEDIHFFENGEILGLSILAKLLANYLVTNENEKNVKQLAYEDPVTNKWNLNMMKNMLVELEYNEFTLLYIDIADFHKINDKFGFDTGDFILKEISDILENTLSQDELLARVVNDQFIIVSFLIDDVAISYKYNTIKDAIKQFVFEKYTTKIDVKMGVYFKNAAETLSFAIDKATKLISMIDDDEELENKLLIYSDEILQKELRQSYIEKNLESALEKHEFVIYLQPSYDVKKRKLRGAEALVRWKKEDKVMYPDEFIPMLEKNRRIIDLDFEVYEMVFRYLRELKNNKQKLFNISMNVSRCHILNSSFHERLLELVKKYNIETKYISLEITESAFVSSIEDLVLFIKKLKDLGFNIYLDDFGIAYSNISFLGQIPVDVLKIDKGFLDHEVSEREIIILKNVFKMAKELGMKILCEGIEGEKELKIVKSLKCDYTQGYYYDKPLPIEDFNKKYVYNNKPIKK